MNIVIRTDASNAIGTGHVTRCLTLANALRKEGANVLFACRKHPGHLIERIESQGFDVVVLPVTNHTSIDSSKTLSSEETLTHAHWLGSDCQTDAEATIEALGGIQVDWLVVDHYGLDYRWESTFNEHVKRIMVIDDLADRKHDCDLLLDQNLVANYETRYDDLVPDHTTMLLGPTYALLQPEYAELHPRTPPRTGPVKRILISFGGVDSHNLTGLVVQSFIDLHRPDIEVDVVLSKNNEYFEELSKSINNHPNIHLHDTVPSLAPLMVKADLAIGAGGATTWERLCLRLPSLVITLADNQIPIARELHDRGLVKYLGHSDEISASSLRVEMENALVKSDNKYNGLLNIEAEGLNILVDIIYENNNIKIRHANIYDYEKIQELFKSSNNLFNDSSNMYNSILRDYENHRLFLSNQKSIIPKTIVHFKKSDEYWSYNAYSLNHLVDSDIEINAVYSALHKLRNQEIQRLVIKKSSVQNTASSSDTDFLRITICTDKDSWMNQYIPKLIYDIILLGHSVNWVHSIDDITPGNICICLSFSQLVSERALGLNDNNIVVHASNLPKGKGWSPTTWMILDNKNEIPLTLFEAAKDVDSGPIYKQVMVKLDDTDLIEDWRLKLANQSIILVKWFISNYPIVLDMAKEQVGSSSYYRKRTPKDSQINIDQKLSESINLLRTVDNERYPAYFEYKGFKYILKIFKSE